MCCSFRQSRARYNGREGVIVKDEICLFRYLTIRYDDDGTTEEICLQTRTGKFEYYIELSTGSFWSTYGTNEYAPVMGNGGGGRMIGAVAL